MNPSSGPNQIVQLADLIIGRNTNPETCEEKNYFVYKNRWMCYNYECDELQLIDLLEDISKNLKISYANKQLNKMKRERKNES